MKINVENFRCYAGQHSFTLPSGGITLLNGESGKGKTTIFKAIYFGLYGVKGKEQTTTFGHKKSRVELVFNAEEDGINVTISRQRSPNHLRVMTPTFTGEDIVAQKWIQEQFGSFFLHTSYLTQKCLDTFFTQTRDVRAEILRSLSISSFDVEKLKQRNKDNTRDRKQLVQSINERYKFIKGELEQRKLTTTMSEPKFPINTVSTRTVEDAIAEEQKQQEHNWKKLTQAQHKLKQTNEELRNAVEANASVSNWKEQVAQLRKEKDEYEKECVMYREANGLLQKTEASYRDLKVLEQKYINTCELIQKQQKMAEMHEEHRTQLAEMLRKIDEEIAMNPYDEEELVAIQAEITYLQSVKTGYRECAKSYKKLAEITTPKNTIAPFSAKEYKNALSYIVPSHWGIVDTAEIEKLLTSCIAQQTSLEDKKKAVYSQLNVSAYKCPHCSTGLAVIKNCIVRHAPEQLKMEYDTIGKQLAEVKEEVSKYQQTVQTQREIRIYFDQFCAVVKQYQECLDDASSIDAELAKSHDDLKQQQTYLANLQTLRARRGDLTNNKVDSLRHLRAEINELVAKCGDVNVDNPQDCLLMVRQDIEQTEAMMSKYRIDVSKYTDTVKRFEQCHMRISELNAKIARVSAIDVEGLRQNVETLETEIQTRRDKAERFDKRKVAIEVYLREADRYKEYVRLSTNLATCKQDLNVAERALTCAIQFARIINEAEAGAMQSFLAMLNEECEKHMQVMFDGELRMIVKYNSVGSDEEVKKSYVDIDIERNGEEVPYDSLSGGESDRCALAMFLAFNKLSKARLLLLDECLSSLHAESVEDIVEHIKAEFADRICVMTLHQTTTGIFDHILEVGT